MIFSNLRINDIKCDIGAWLRQLRKQRGITQHELGEQLNLSRITIQNIENGKNFTMDTLLLILQHFEELHDFNAFIQRKKEESNPPIDSIY